MEIRYKAVISNKNLYKEIELEPQAGMLRVGTDVDCDVRLRKDMFFGRIELDFQRKGNDWTVVCSDNLYLTAGDIRKLMTKNLEHGDVLEVRYQESDIELFNLAFIRDFDYENRIYDTEVDIQGREHLIIGGAPQADICLSDENIGTDCLALKNNGGEITVFDLGTRYGVCVNGTRIEKQRAIKDFDFFSVANYSFYYKKGKLYTAGNGRINFRGVNAKQLTQQTTHFQYPNFVRNTRIEYCIPEDEIEIQQPLPKPQKPKKNILFTLIPSITMLILMVVMRGILGGGSTFVIYSVCSMAIGIIMSVVTYISDGREYREAVKKREEEYTAYIQNKEGEVAAARMNELRIRNMIQQSLPDSINEVFMFGKRIFEKSDKNKDFLDIYLGRGTVEAKMPVKYTKQEFIDTEDPIAQLPAEIEKKYRYIEDAPIVSRFNKSDGVGIIGSKAMLHSILKNITLDLAIRHFYREVKMYYILSESDLASMSWLRWLKHVHNDETGIRNFMCDEESRKLLFENLYSILSERETAKKENETINFATYYVVFVLDSEMIRKHPISRYVENCNRYGFTFVFFEEYEEFLPKGCMEIIRLNEGQNSGILLMSENGDHQQSFTYNTVSNSLAETIALKLGAVTVEEVSLESELTKNITMYELLNIIAVDDLDLKKRWSASQVFKSMAAPLGVKTKNEIVYLDISDKANAHGPHGLVAGTTGSGKSEILQTYVLSMATLFHPYDVGFVIIDFKGGGMANQFKDLPHMMGAITNIDGREINRSLLSIKAELVKRQALFAEAGVNHINDYIKLYKKGNVEQPLPHLIIIVDEFAELKAEFPDFMKELISAARIGRTLGVHLILATQKPAGVVDAQIWSNSKFKLCLKVQTKEDSNEVIKTPLAAEIVEPGRAYFQVGNNEIFELFQSAYSGVKVTDDADDKSRIYSIYALNSWGKKTLVYTNKKKSVNENVKNQLQAIVDYVKEFCQTSNIKKLKGICLPPLEKLVKRDDLKMFEVSKSQNIVVPVGIYDDPERQEQGAYRTDLSDSNTYVVGSAMSGKTTFLQTILLQVMDSYTPADVNVYIIDCGNMALKVFENSGITGGVAIAGEEEKVTNLFKMLFRIMEERKKIFAEKSLGTHKAYKEAGYSDMPQIILMIDNLAAFREYYDNLSDKFLALSREGISLGISVVATATQTNAMNYKALSNYATRIALVCKDNNEYSNLFDRCRMEPKDTAGRGLCVMDKRILEFQTALCVDGEKEYVRVENIRREILRCNEKYEGIKAAEIPVVPEIIRYKDIKGSELYRQTYKIPLGLDYNTVQYKMLDLLSLGLLATMGREESGKTNFIKHLFAAINDNIFASLTEAYVIGNSEHTLSFANEYGFVAKYTTDISDLETIVSLIEDLLEKRQKKYAESPVLSFEEEPLLLLVIENTELADVLQKDKELSAKLVKLVKQYRRYKFAVILSELENIAVAFSASEFIKFVKENKKFILFDDLGNAKFFDVSVKQVKENSKPAETGDAFVCFSGNVDRVKTICMEVSENGGK